MRKIKLYPAPHLEIRVHVSDQMESDLRLCRQLAEEHGDGGNCETCSWGGVEFENTGMCELPEVAEKVLENNEH